MDYVVVFCVIELLYVVNDDISERHHYSRFVIFERHILILIYCDEENTGERDMETDRL